ncbi:2-dehydropantoate 2-reductase [Cokeromyces recurvatus]|uniref:2-dehydropantoate 2-reductase n=1 Tax=Cokeromyces recurvatus TaxID=90255 RepID=UPI0022204B19|nr:2-dehydropantoate 2-reductase [Cokeromyces recurvatus]KAI7907292.1 2-dehydropantoate 2-reductase [Cokeromyces recurvatus]
MVNIHILGTGAIGCHIGAVLKSHQNKVTLLLRSQSHFEDFKNKQNSITYRCQGKANVIAGFDADVVGENANKPPIESLIVSTKANHTLNAIKQVIPRLSSQSTILLLQNGMGVAEELVDNLWPNKAPPTILIGVNRHAVERIASYDICHHSGYQDPDALRIGQFPTKDHSSVTIQESKLLQKIIETPELQAAQLSWEEIRVKMYKKLIVNACINPVASLLMSKNIGTIKNGNPGGIAMMRAICEEAYDVFKDDLPGESVNTLMNMVLAINKEAGENICSTLQDIKANRLTEIDYINGYICKMGYKKNISVKSNQAIVNLIHAKEALYE